MPLKPAPPTTAVTATVQPALGLVGPGVQSAACAVDPATPMPALTRTALIAATIRFRT
jgi:hypothetical protein